MPELESCKIAVDKELGSKASDPGFWPGQCDGRRRCAYMSMTSVGLRSITQTSSRPREFHLLTFEKTQRYKLAKCCGTLS